MARWPFGHLIGHWPLKTQHAPSEPREAAPRRHAAPLFLMPSQAEEGGYKLEPPRAPILHVVFLPTSSQTEDIRPINTTPTSISITTQSYHRHHGRLRLCFKRKV